MIRKTAIAALASLAGLIPGLAFAQSVTQPQPWQMNLQPPGSETMERIVSFHNELIYIITVITLFVLALLIYIVIRFNAKSNPTPSKTSHNTVLEILWTVIPIMILVYIAIPSFKLLFFEGRFPDAQMTLKVTGHQWFWSYAYPDQGNFGFDSLVKCRTPEECAGDKDDKGNIPIRLLDVDNPVVVPVDTVVRIQIVSDDVIHSWAVPSLGIKTDAVPGRLQETWFKIEHEGRYYGQCSQLCGQDHGFMPIAIEVVSKEAFAAWVKAAPEKFKAQNEEPVPAKEVAEVNR
ncbi:MAG: cytochrome c oxidase subunit II [Alphaproteobacteria bacterium]